MIENIWWTPLIMRPALVAKKSSGSSIVDFKSLRINNENFSIGDVVMIKEINDDCCYGTLIRIWKNRDKSDSFAKIRWFYKPSDIFETDHEFISQAELIDSDHEQDIWVVCLYSTARVLSLEEYHSLDEVDDDTFFTRAKYFHKEKIVRPGFEEWKRVCSCNAILNPDHLYLSCDNCTGLYHPECVGFVENEDEPWLCPKCRLTE